SSSANELTPLPVPQDSSHAELQNLNNPPPAAAGALAAVPSSAILPSLAASPAPQTPVKDVAREPLEPPPSPPAIATVDMATASRITEIEKSVASLNAALDKKSAGFDKKISSIQASLDSIQSKLDTLSETATRTAAPAATPADSYQP